MRHPTELEHTSKVTRLECTDVLGSAGNVQDWCLEIARPDESFADESDWHHD